MMEKVTFQNSRGLDLVGNLHYEDGDKIVILCHGFTGDKSEWGRFDELAAKLNEGGFNVLAFDFSGSGESDDDSLTVEKQVDDLKSAILFVKGRGMKKIGIVGLSLGGLVAVKAFSDQISALVMWAPVTDAKPGYEKRFSKIQLAELKEKGYITYKRDKGIRRTIRIDEQMIRDRTAIDQPKVLSKVNIPVLIIHGDADKRVPLKWSESAIKHLPKGSHLHVVEGAGHDLEQNLNSTITLTAEWFKSRL